jgi:Putative porin
MMKKELVVMIGAAMLGASAAAAAAPVKKSHAAAVQASAEDLAAIRDQMQALANRVQKLEQANQTLSAENAELKQKTDAATEAAQQVKQVQTDVDNTQDLLAKTRAGLPEWASRVTLKGDFRYRHEEIRSGTDRVASTGLAAVGSQDRQRDRLRVRLGIVAKVSDKLNFGLRLASGESNLDPRSPNVTLSGYSQKKTIAIDQAYFEWNPRAEWKVSGGKIAYPWVRPAQSLFYDNDINPEGLAVNYSNGLFFASAFGFWLNEVAPSGPSDKADAEMLGAQFGIKYPFTATASLTAGINYFDHGAIKNRTVASLFGGSSNGNSSVNVGTAAAPDLRLRDDFNIGEVFAEYNRIIPTAAFGELPFSFFVEYAKNNGAQDFDKAYSGGFSLGKASAPGSWELGYFYEKSEKNALFGQWVDSDFGAGNTDSKGHVIKAGYAPTKNMVINLTYFLNKLNVDTGVATAGNPVRNYDRLQVDFNYKY